MCQYRGWKKADKFVDLDFNEGIYFSSKCFKNNQYAYAYPRTNNSIAYLNIETKVKTAVWVNFWKVTMNRNINSWALLRTN